MHSLHAQDEECLHMVSQGKPKSQTHTQTQTQTQTLLNPKQNEEFLQMVSQGKLKQTQTYLDLKASINGLGFRV